MMNQIPGYKIVKVNPNNLIVLNEKISEKYYYRQYCIKNRDQIQQFIARRDINHNSIIKIKQMTIQQLNQKIVIGIYFQFYILNLENQIKKGKAHISSSQILNTFQPLLDAFQHLHKNQLHPSAINLHNVVMTESGQVKYLDQIFLMEGELNNVFQQNKTAQQDYYELLQLLLDLIQPINQRNKRWKQRSKKIKQKYSQQLFNFIEKLCHLSNYEHKLIEKTKQIKKTKVTINNQNKYKDQKKNKNTKKIKQENITDHFIIKGSN